MKTFKPFPRFAKRIWAVEEIGGKGRYGFCFRCCICAQVHTPFQWDWPDFSLKPNVDSSYYCLPNHDRGLKIAIMILALPLVEAHQRWAAVTALILIYDLEKWL